MPLNLRHANARCGLLALIFSLLVHAAVLVGQDAQHPTMAERFAPSNLASTPDFRRHIVPLFGRLGCNGRSCHGSFGGQGGFRLSLFGYDPSADFEALLRGDHPRVDVDAPLASLLLFKPMQADDHGGGELIQAGTWEYELLRRWIVDPQPAKESQSEALQRLEIFPSEIVFERVGERRPFHVLATWSDGTQEDVTSLCRFQLNEDSIARMDPDGSVESLASGATHLVAFYDHGVAVADIIQPVVGDHPTQSAEGSPTNRIDILVASRLKKLGILPSTVCSDTEFLRRVGLDLTGTLPIPSEIESFVEDSSPEKRRVKVEELLERPTYVARWTDKLCDITGNSPRHFQDRAPPDEFAKDWYAWLARRVEANTPYDEIAAGIVRGISREPGQAYEEYIAHQSAYYRDAEPLDFASRDNMPYFWVRRNMRTPEERALAISYSFLGIRIECAQCHKHPFDRWTQDDFKGFSAIFENVGYGIAPPDRKRYQAMLDELADAGNQAQRERARLLRAKKGIVVPWQEVYISPPGTRMENGRDVKAIDAVPPKLLGGRLINTSQHEDRRGAFVDWLRDPTNPYFAKVFVNRVWAEYFGIGIVDPPDDLNQANPPSNKALLDYLTTEFIARGFDMKWLHREIVNSETYQRSMEPNATNLHDERNFSRTLPRRLPAAILFDAIEQATSHTDQMERAVVDVEARTIGPLGGAFVGRRSADDFASKVFGRTQRESNCDCSWSNEPNLLQAIYLHNDKEIHSALERKSGWLAELRDRSKTRRQFFEGKELELRIQEAFLRTVSRLPSEFETARAKQHIAESKDPLEGLHELLWSLLNLREFVTNH